MPGFHAHHFRHGTDLSLKLEYNVSTAQYAISAYLAGTSWEIASLEREDLRPLFEALRDEFEAPDADEAGGADAPQDDDSEPQIPFA